MTDRLHLKALNFYGYHGVLPREREEGQLFEVDVELGYDQRPAAASDDLDKAVDAYEVYQRIKTVVEGPPCNLLETVAQRVADRLLDLPRVETVIVRLRKPQAGFHEGIEEGYGVEITRR